jgi:hypothetical protein
MYYSLDSYPLQMTRFVYARMSHRGTESIVKYGASMELVLLGVDIVLQEHLRLVIHLGINVLA